jgi:glycosyltransferase involved in cell wall biosynthesis
MNITKISVVIPTYNAEKFIRRTLDSVFNQEGLHKLFELEVFVCDDCSTDKTIEICKQYNVKVIKNDKNTGGPNRGRNNGIKYASGDLIAFLDHDDEWLPWKLKEQIKKINEGYEFIYSYCIKKLG